MLNPLSQHKTRLEWIRSICPSWLSWGRPQFHLAGDTLGLRQVLLEPLSPAATSPHRLVKNTATPTLTERSWRLIVCVFQNRPPWMSSGPTENRSFQGMHGGPTGPGGPHNFPPPMPSMGGPPMPPNPNGLPPPWMQPPPPPMGQGPGPHGHPMSKTQHSNLVLFPFHL